MSVSASPAVGIDFGTTNSSVALAGPEGVRLVQFPSLTGPSASSRSLLYLQRRTEAPGKPVSVFTGAEAIEHYLATDSFDDAFQGRLMQSLKSYLAVCDLTGTEVFGRQYAFEDLVARILRDLRTRASAFFGFPVTRALVGRPVHFVNADTEADNDFAQARLHRALTLAGFTEIAFALEPVAAAYAYQTSLPHTETVLIGDFGGGTTDFALLRLGPGTPPAVLGSTGVGLAGDAFDARVVRYLVSPALGSDSEARSGGKRLPALPAWIYSNLERWHTLSFLRTHAVRDLLRSAEQRALEPDKIQALRSVVDHDLGYLLHGAVQRLKIDLSTHPEAEFRLRTDPLTLTVPVTRTQFESWIAPDLARMEASLDQLLTQTGTPPAQVDQVFLTGGTSLVPAVTRLFTTRFGAARVHHGEAFTSVAYGLARMAQSPLTPR